MTDTPLIKAAIVALASELDGESMTVRTNSGETHLGVFDTGRSGYALRFNDMAIVVNWHSIESAKATGKFTVY